MGCAADPALAGCGSAGPLGRRGHRRRRDRPRAALCGNRRRWPPWKA